MADLIPVIVLAAVTLIITVKDKIRIMAPWQAMLGGAATVLLFGFPFSSAIDSINWGVMLFLFGMFVLASLLVESGYLQHLGYKVLRHFSSPKAILLAFIFAIGIGSAFLLNDTVAIIGVPVALALSRKSGIHAVPLIVGVAVAVTIGSVASPIGNPQNFIIASQPGFGEPFGEFAAYLLVPAALALAGLAALLWVMFPELKKLKTFDEDAKDRKHDYWASRTGFQAVIALSALRALSGFWDAVPKFELFWIAIAGAGIAVVLSRKPANALKADYETLAFFAGMFILMRAVWDSGILEQFLPSAQALADPGIVLGSSIILSQVFSNVPFVVLYLRALVSPSVGTLVLLAAGSTLAGGITFLGAASNIIVMQAAEKQGAKLPFKEFTIAGIASVAMTMIAILAWMKLMGV